MQKANRASRDRRKLHIPGARDLALGFEPGGTYPTRRFYDRWLSTFTRDKAFSIPGAAVLTISDYTPGDRYELRVASIKSQEELVPSGRPSE